MPSSNRGTTARNPISKAVKFLDSLANAGPAKRKTWFGQLTTEAQEALIEARDMYNKGATQASLATIQCNAQEAFGFTVSRSTFRDFMRSTKGGS